MRFGRNSKEEEIKALPSQTFKLGITVVIIHCLRALMKWVSVNERNSKQRKMPSVGKMRLGK